MTVSELCGVGGNGSVKRNVYIGLILVYIEGLFVYMRLTKDLLT
jgi:hypothetical protein